jgi:hypothetical protein
MRNMHAKFHEFGMHRKVYMNLSEIYTKGYHESRRFEYMTMKCWFRDSNKIYIIFF